MSEKDPNGLDQHTPGAKLDDNKLLASVVLAGFADALKAVTEVGSFGAKKYTKFGWRTVENGEERYEDAQLRHWLATKCGEEIDPDSGLSHLAHEAWNVLARLQLKLNAEKARRLTSENRVDPQQKSSADGC